MEKFVLNVKAVCPRCGHTLNSNDNIDKIIYCECGALGIDCKNVYTRDLNLLELSSIEVHEIDIPEGYKITDNEKIVDHMRKSFIKDMHCPCQIQKTDDTLCSCKNFKDTGICKCGLWIKE